jgi:L-cysteine desulfidase
MTEKICIFEAFGIETNSKISVCFRGPNHLIYLIGSNLITLDLKSKKSRITQIKTHGKVEYLNVTNDMENLILIDMEKRDTYISLIDLNTINYKLIRLVNNIGFLLKDN